MKRAFSDATASMKAGAIGTNGSRKFGAAARI
jgi:hypothetical protein